MITVADFVAGLIGVRAGGDRRAIGQVAEGAADGT